MSNLNWQQLVSRREKWVLHNFPTQELTNPTDSILGMTEEVGELAHSHLKKKQGIRGTPEGHDANMKDAVGDITVFMFGVMSAYGVPRERFRHHFTDPYKVGNDLDRIVMALSTEVTDIAFHFLCDSRPQRMMDAVESVIGYLGLLCTRMQWDYDRIVLDTWASVETRDWIAYPENGRPPAGMTKQEKASSISVGIEAEAIRTGQPDARPYHPED